MTTSHTPSVLAPKRSRWWLVFLAFFLLGCVVMIGFGVALSQSGQGLHQLSKNDFQGSFASEETHAVPALPRGGLVQPWTITAVLSLEAPGTSPWVCTLESATLSLTYPQDKKPEVAGELYGNKYYTVALLTGEPGENDTLSCTHENAENFYVVNKRALLDTRNHTALGGLILALCFTLGMGERTLQARTWRRP